MAETVSFPAAPGTYLLLLECPAPAQVRAGALGLLTAAPGWYAYAGSAFGPGGLAGRLKHHLSAGRPQHWHIDALKTAASVRQVWYTLEQQRVEHVWAQACAALPGVSIPWPGFGASDCACPAHLCYRLAPFDPGAFDQALRRLHPGQAALEIVRLA